MQETEAERRARVKAEAARKLAAGELREDQIDQFMADNGVKPLDQVAPSAPAAPAAPVPGYKGPEGAVGPTAEAAASVPKPPEPFKLGKYLKDKAIEQSGVGSAMELASAIREGRMGDYIKKGVEAQGRHQIASGNAVLANIPLADDAVGALRFLREPYDPHAFQKGRHQVFQARESAEKELGGLGYTLRAGLPTVAGAVGASFIPGVGPGIGWQMLTGGLLEGARRFGQAGSHLEEESPEAMTRFKEGGIGAVLGAVAPPAMKGLGLTAGFTANKLLPYAARLALRNPTSGPSSKIITEELVKPTWQAGARAASEWVGETLTPELEAASRAVAEHMPGRTGSGLERFMGKTGRIIADALEPRDQIYHNRIAGQHLPGTANEPVLGNLDAAAERAKLQVAQTNLELKAAADELEATQVPVFDRVKEAQARVEGTVGPRVQAAKDAQGSRALGVINQMRNPEVSATALRPAVRNAQVSEGRINYAPLEGVAPPAQVPVKLYQIIQRDPALRAAYTDAIVEREGDMLTQAAAGVHPTQEIVPPTIPRVKIGSAKDAPEMPELDLSTFDRMKRSVNARIQQYFSGGDTGIDAAKGAKLIARINEMEEEFVGLHSAPEQDILNTARAEWRHAAETLEALKEGQNLQRLTGSTATESITKGGPRDIDHFRATTLPKIQGHPDTQEAFQIGGQGSFSGLLGNAGETTEGALAAMERIGGSPNARARLNMAYDPATSTIPAEVEALQPDNVAAVMDATRAHQTARVAARLPKVESIGQQQIARLTAPIQQRQAGLATQLAGQEAVAARLGQMQSIPFQQALADPFGQPALTLADVTLPSMGAGAQRKAAEIAGSLTKTEMQGMTAAQIVDRLTSLSKNRAATAMFGQGPNKALEVIKQIGPTRQAARLLAPYGVARIAGAAADASSYQGALAPSTIRGLTRDPVQVYDPTDSTGAAIILPDGINGPVSSAAAGAARSSTDLGVEDTSQIYVSKTGRRVIDTHQYPTYNSKGEVEYPTHAVEGISGRRDGESFLDYEKRVMKTESWPTDVKAVNNKYSSLRPEVRESLLNMIRAAREEGHIITLAEALRSTDRQEWLFRSGRKDKEPVKTWTLTSNHADSSGADLRVRNTKGEEVEAGYKWLQENAERFGLHPIGWKDKGHVERPRSMGTMATKRDSTIPMKSSDVRNP